MKDAPPTNITSPFCLGPDTDRPMTAANQTLEDDSVFDEGDIDAEEYHAIIKTSDLAVDFK